MQDHTQEEYICHLCSFLPERRPGTRGTKPIPKEVLIKELFKLFRTNCGWRNINHSSTCRSYLHEMQRRGLFNKFLNFITKDEVRHRHKKSTIDSSDIVSYRTNKLVRYSGKYHNYCIKLTIETTSDCVPIGGRLDIGSRPDSLILDDLLLNRDKLPYEMYLDKGYERRRDLSSKGCQVRIEMKKNVKNRKRGPRFSFTDDHKRIRGEIEKVVAWLKSFMIMRLNRLRIKSLISGIFLFCLSYIAFMRLK